MEAAAVFKTLRDAVFETHDSGQYSDSILPFTRNTFSKGKEHRRTIRQELSSGPKQMEITLFNLDTGKVEEDD
jgi:hypothetical protein